MLIAARHQRDARPARSRGFTLLELVVTIALLGLLVMLSVPSFVSWIRNTQIRTVAESLQTGIRSAQAEAVRRNRQVVLFFTNNAPTSATTCTPLPCAVAGGKRWAIQTVAQFGESAEFITGGKLTDIASPVAIANDMAATAICFNSNGRLIANTSPGVDSATCPIPTPPATSSNFDVTGAGADRPLRVILQLGGQIRMCDPNRPTLSANSPDGCPAPAAP